MGFPSGYKSEILIIQEQKKGKKTLNDDQSGIRLAGNVRTGYLTVGGVEKLTPTPVKTAGVV